MDYISIIATSYIAAGALGPAHRATLEVVTSTGKKLTYDTVIKIAFSKRQQKMLRYEYSVYEHLASSNVQGIPTILGLFQDELDGPLIMLSSHNGVDLRTSRLRSDRMTVTVLPHEE